MANKINSEIRLGRLELQIMNVVWDRGKATVHDVKNALSRRKPAYSTILTMMRKLEAKGYLKHEVDGRTYVYLPLISQQAVRHGVLGDLVERLFEGSTSLLLTSLVEQNRISKNELRQIRKLIEERGKNE
ncbi:MAG TPA: BlaI/MecI/CopY family transcriptional regulator [Sedimentisphaerales bacterium]|nr:BlaI/MecI/CopY family transcriptional regulator [Sedimentisphaerales bacterium]